MKPYLSLFLIASVFCFGQSNSVLVQVPHTYSLKEASQNVTDWDWIMGDTLMKGVPHYFIYFQSRTSILHEAAAIAPWYQEGAWAGLNDRFKEDGWVLLAKDFGEPERRISEKLNAYFALYNKHRSVIRIFILISKMMDGFDYSTISLSPYNNGGPSTGVLANLAPITYAADKIEKTFRNSTSSVVNTMAGESRWIYADFPLSYDPTLSSDLPSDLPPGLEFKVFGTIVSELKLETKGFSAQGDKKFIDGFMKRNHFDSPGFSLNADNMPSVDIGFGLNDVSIKATPPNWDGLKSYLSGVKMDIGLGSMDLGNPFEGLMSGFSNTLSAMSLASPLNITGLDLGSVFKFFVGGGMKSSSAQQASPTFISSHYSTSGTMTTKKQYAVVTFPIPGTRSNYSSPTLGSAVGLVSNEPVGIFSLSKTPRISKKTLIVKAPTYYSPSAYQAFLELEAMDPLEFKINPAAKLQLVNIEASMVLAYNRAAENGSWLMDRINSSNQKYLLRFEGPSGGGPSVAMIRSMAVPEKYFKGRKIYQTNIVNPDVKVRVKAIFKRIDDNTAQPIVFISMYSTDIVDQGVFNENYVIAKMPTIPPQNVQCIVPSVGGVRISWDRNQEGNISQYIVERSINSGSYVVIGKTKDTLVVDNEIEKSVKPYLSNRVNVSVNYRVRAKSEWFDDDSTKQVQFSDYSNVVSIAGSMINTLGKFGTEQIIPTASTISQNFPNPFNPSTTIYYGVKSDGPVSIKVFNAIGQEVATLVNERKEVGYHYVEWNASGMPSGMYLYRIQTADNTETRKMTLMK